MSSEILHTPAQFSHSAALNSTQMNNDEMKQQIKLEFSATGLNNIIRSFKVKEELYKCSNIYKKIKRKDVLIEVGRHTPCSGTFKYIQEQIFS